MDALRRRARLIGVDLGTKTIGLALSDVERRIATPLETIRRVKFTPDAERIKAWRRSTRSAGSWSACRSTWTAARAARAVDARLRAQPQAAPRSAGAVLGRAALDGRGDPRPLDADASRATRPSASTRWRRPMSLDRTSSLGQRIATGGLQADHLCDVLPALVINTLARADLGRCALGGTSGGRSLRFGQLMDGRPPSRNPTGPFAADRSLSGASFTSLFQGPRDGTRSSPSRLQDRCSPAWSHPHGCRHCRTSSSSEHARAVRFRQIRRRPQLSRLRRSYGPS